MVVLKNTYKEFKKWWKTVLISLLVLLLLFYKLYWLLIGVLAIYLFRLVLLFLFVLIKNKLLLKLAKGVLFFCLIFMFSIAAKLFVFGVFKIPSSSMENTLYPNDVILVNKLIYGPQLPTSPFDIPWVNFLFYLHKQSREKLDLQWWDYGRLSGIANIKQGDVLVFQESRTFFVVKRCLGLPGDTFKISNGEVITNDQKYVSPARIKNKYLVTVKDRDAFYASVDTLQIETTLYPSAAYNNKIQGVLDEETYMQLNKLASVSSIEKQIAINENNEDLFLEKNVYNWSVDSMGPFTIPKKGLRIPLDDYTFNVYAKTLQMFEKVRIIKENGVFYIDGQIATSYTFKKDYIFVMGDHRKNSKDSRYIGFVPYETVVGKVQYVLYSNYNDLFHWDRFFKKVV